MRLVLSLVLLGLSAPAFAGGVGVLGTGGLRNDRVYFYDKSKDMRQYIMPETIGNAGAGLEFVLGDRDDKILGVFRGYWLMETPQKDPADLTGLVDNPEDNVVAAWRTDLRHVGVASVGLQVGIIGDPRELQLVGVASLGSGFLTRDHTEFLMGEAGAGGTYMVGRDFQMFANATYNLRYQKAFFHGGNVYVGARYLFD